jgi:glycosyltransferase involved in cell wall biosynthesis
MQKIPDKDIEKVKVLHIGNIANNAYIAAQILNENGIQSDVLVADYYHIGGSAEWESAEIEGDWGNDFFPAWHKVNLGDFKRPRWFAQGPRHLAMHYLISRKRNNWIRASILWSLMALARRVYTWRWQKLAYPFLAAFRTYGLYYMAYMMRREKKAIPRALFPGAENVKPPLPSERVAASFPPRRKKLTFPDYRPLTKDEEEDKRNAQPVEYSDADLIRHLDYEVPLLKELFRHYDIVIGYSTDGIWPLLSNKPYIAFEHGTIRTIPFEDSVLGRQTAAVYREADAVLITNSDANAPAERLGLKDYRFLPHPTQERHYDEQRETAAMLRQKLMETRDADFIVFHPARHHWVVSERNPDWEKGNDLTIRAFASMVHDRAVRGLLIMVEAGQMVDKSKRLVDELRITDRVLWMKPQPHRSFVRFIMASDVVVDQFHLRPLAFGGIPPKAMLCGVPVITNFSDQIIGWCYETMPPFINVGTADDIAHELYRLHSEPGYGREIGLKGQEWYRENYSNRVFLEVIAGAIGDVLDRRARRDTEKRDILAKIHTGGAASALAHS